MLVRIAIILFLGLASPAFAQRGGDLFPQANLFQQDEPEPLPTDPAGLVANMSNVEVAWEFRSRGGPQSTDALAAVALIRMKDEAIPELVKALKSGNATLKINAAYVLGGIGTPATIAPLIAAAGDDNPKVRVAAVSGLPAYSDQKARLAMIEALSDKDAKVRTTAGRRLPAYGDQAARQALIKALADEDPLVRNAAIFAFHPQYSETKPDNSVAYATAKVLIPMLDAPETQRAAAEVLGELGSNVACLPLLKLFSSDDERIRWTAAESLGKLKSKQVTLELVRLLRDEDASVRRITADSLGQIGDMRATPYLVAGLADDEFYVRRDCAAALGKIGDRRAVEPLTKLLQDSDRNVVAATAEALGEIGDASAVPSLIAVLPKTEPRVAMSIAKTLGELGDVRAVEPLADCLLANAKANNYTGSIVESLAKIRHPDAVAAMVRVILTGEDTLMRHQLKGELGDLVGQSFRFDSNEKVKAWWEQNRADYERAVE